MADGVFDEKMKQNPYAPWGWDYVGDGVNINGDLDMGGHKVVNMGAPANDNDAATKKYVDDAIAAGGGGGGGGPTTANLVQLTPTGNIQATNVQDAFAEMAQEAAIKDEANVFTQKQTIGGADIEEVAAAVPYRHSGLYAKGNVTNISSQNPVNFETPDITMNGDRVPASLIGYQPSPGSEIQGTNVQEAINTADVLFKYVRANYVAKTGLTEDFSAETHKITNLAPGTVAGDAVNLDQLNSKVDMTDYVTLTNKVTQNSTEIQNIKDGTTPIESDNVSFTPASGGTLDGQDTVQKALTQVDTLMKGVQTSITDLKNADKTFVTKSGGVLESDLNAAGFTVAGLKTPGADGDAANRKYVDDQVAAIKGALSGQLQWAGTYDCDSSTIQSLSAAATASGHFTQGKNLPTATPATNNFYFIVTNKVPKVPNPPAPNKALSAGDWILGDSAAWEAIELSKTVSAANVTFASTGSISSKDVQAAIAELDTDLVATTKKIDDLTAGNPKLGADKIAYTEKTPGVITGTTVQEALVAADGLMEAAQSKISANEKSITALQTAMNSDVAKLSAANVFAEINTFNKVPTIAAGQVSAQPTDVATVQTVTDQISAITASKISYDNSTSQIPSVQNAYFSIYWLSFGFAVYE